MTDDLRTRDKDTRRLALQSTAEIWRGLDVLDAELKLGRFSDARKTVGIIRQLVKVADSAWVAALREQSQTSQAAESNRLDAADWLERELASVGLECGAGWVLYHLVDGVVARLNGAVDE